MRASAKIFWILGTFFLLVAIGYGIVTGNYEPLGIEPVGFPALLGTAGLAFMIAMVLSLTARKHDVGPSDDLDAEVDEHGGVQGSFAPYSWAPLWCGIGAALCFLGVAAGWWIFSFGIIFALYGIMSWVLEFSVGQHEH
jgi:Cytochrome c oxidase subunit IV